MKLWTLSLLLTGLCALGQTTTVRISTNTPLVQGDQVVWSGSAWIPLNKGTNGQVLSMIGTNVGWANPTGGSGSGLIESVSEDFEVTGGELALTNALGTGPLVRQSAASGVGTVTSVGASTTVSGLGFSGSPVTGSGTLSLTGVVAVASGGTGATDASGARTSLSLVPGTDVQAYDADLSAVAALANAGIIVRTGAGTVSARAITGDTEAVVSNGDGVSGNPTLSIGAAIARDSEVSATYAPLASPALTGSPTAPTASPGTSNTVLATTAFVLSNGGGGGGDAYLANSQTFAGTNTFTGPVTISGPLTISTQTVDVLNIGSLGLGTNIIGLANGGTGATNAAGARAALGTDNGDNITSGTVADARIASSIARDSEVSGTYAPLASPAFTASATIGGTNVLDYAASHLTEAEASVLYQRTNAVLTATVAGTAVSVAQTNAVSFGAPVLYVGTTNVAAALAAGGGGGSDTNWNGTPIASGTITNLYFDQLNGAPRYGLYLYDEFLNSASLYSHGTHYSTANAGLGAGGATIYGGNADGAWGSLRFYVGTSASGYAIAGSPETAFSIGDFAYLKHECRVRIPTLSATGQAFVWQWGFGTSFSGTNNSDAIIFEHNANTPFWMLRCINNSTATTNLTSVAVTNIYTVLSLEYFNSTTNVVFSVNRSPVWTNNVNVPKARPTGFRSGTVKSEGTSNRDVFLDWLRTFGTFNNER